MTDDNDADAVRQSRDVYGEDANTIREQLEHLGPWRAQVGLQALRRLSNLVCISEQAQMILRRDQVIREQGAALAACRDALTTTTRERDDAEQHAKEQERQRIEMDEWAAKVVGEAEALVGRLEEALRDIADGRYRYSVNAIQAFARAALGGEGQHGKDEDDK